MKRLLLFLTLASCIIIPAGAHDFAYYEQKTRELLPILGIDGSEVTFVPTHHEPSVDQRMKSPKTVFINLEKLSTMTNHSALFECAMQAQLTEIDWNDGDFDYHSSPDQDMILGLAYSIPMIVPTLLKITRCINMRQALLGIITVGTLSMALCGYHGHKIKAAQCETWTLEVFEKKKLDKYYQIFTKLVEHTKTAPVAFAGLNALYLQQKRVFSYRPIFTDSVISDVQIGMDAYTLHSTIRTWIQSHPQEWQRIQTELPQDIVALFNENPDNVADNKSK